MHERRMRHTPRLGLRCPDRRKQLWERREHTSLLRILWISLDRLWFEFRTVTLR